MALLHDAQLVSRNGCFLSYRTWDWLQPGVAEAHGFRVPGESIASVRCNFAEYLVIAAWSFEQRPFLTAQAAQSEWTAASQ